MSRPFIIFISLFWPSLFIRIKKKKTNLVLKWMVLKGVCLNLWNSLKNSFTSQTIFALFVYIFWRISCEDFCQQKKSTRKIYLNVFFAHFLSPWYLKRKKTHRRERERENFKFKNSLCLNQQLDIMHTAAFLIFLPPPSPPRWHSYLISFEVHFLLPFIVAIKAFYVAFLKIILSIFQKCCLWFFFFVVCSFYANCCLENKIKCRNDAWLIFIFI